MKITRVKLPRKGEIHSYVIAGDWHTQALDIPSYLILKKLSKQIPRDQRRLIINGDFLDCEHLMGKHSDLKRWSGDAFHIEHLVDLTEEEFAWGNNILDELQEIFDCIYFVLGNHEIRYDIWRKGYCPSAYKHNFNLESRLGLKERGIPLITYNNWLDVGDLSITHGMFHGSTCLKKHYEASGGNNVIFSHIHHSDVKSFASRGKTKKVWSLPAMCNLNPDYIKNRENNWSNGFGIFHVKSNGHFNMNVFEVWDGELVLPNGKMIK